MPVEIVLVRHGETDCNLQKIVQGWSDEDLNATGKQQAADLGKSIENEVFTRIFCSDLRRCRTTLKCVLSQLKVPVPPTVFDRRLRDRDYGDCNGRTVQEIVSYAKEQGCTTLDTFNPTSGETYQEAACRVFNFFDDLFSKLGDNEKVLIVTHSLAQGTVVDYMQDQKEIYDVGSFLHERFSLPCNTGVTRFTVGARGTGWEGKRKVTFLCVNDDSHLKGGSSDSSHNYISQILREHQDT